MLAKCLGKCLARRVADCQNFRFAQFFGCVSPSLRGNDVGRHWQVGSGDLVMVYNFFDFPGF